MSNDNISKRINAAIYNHNGIRKLREAISTFDKILKAFPNDPEVLLSNDNIRKRINAAIYNHNGIRKLREAISTFDKILKAFPNDPEVLFCKGYVYCKLGRYGTAIECFDECITSKGESEYKHHAQFFKGYALKELRRNVDAFNALGLYLGDPGNDKTFELEALCNKGHVLKDLGRYEEALKEFEIAISKLDEETSRISKSDDLCKAKREYCLYYMGYMLFEKGKVQKEDNREYLTDYQAALEMLKECLKINIERNGGIANNPYVIAKLSEVINYQKEKFGDNEILKMLKSSIVAPGNGETHHESPDGAELKGIEKFECGVDLYYEGNGLRLIGSNFAAEKFFNKLIEQAIKQGKKDAHVYALFFKACALSGRGKYDHALACLKECHHFAPNDRDIIFNIGKTYRQQGNNLKAIEAFDTCIELAKEEGRIDKDSLMGKGSALTELGEYGEALKCFEKYKEQREEDRKQRYKDLKVGELTKVGDEYLLYNIGNAYNGLKCYEKAIVELERALAISPKNEYACLNKAYALMSINERGDTLRCVQTNEIDTKSSCPIYQKKGYEYIKEAENGCLEIKNAEELYENAIEQFSICLYRCKPQNECENRLYSIINYEYATIKWIEKKAKETKKAKGEDNFNITFFEKVWHSFRVGEYGDAYKKIIQHNKENGISDTEKKILNNFIKAKEEKFEFCAKIFEDGIHENPLNEDIRLNNATLLIKKRWLVEENKHHVTLHQALDSINLYFKKYEENKQRNENKDISKDRRMEAILIKIFLLGVLELYGSSDKKDKEPKSLHCYFNKYQEKIQGVDTVALLGLFSKEERGQAKETIKVLLEYDNFFKDALGKHDEVDKGILSNAKDVYKEIYIKSLEIIRLLHVDIDCEQSVAHYTKKEVAALFAFDPKSRLRLYSVPSANDPKEGVTLLDFLGVNQEQLGSNYQSFVGCFTFDHDSLNQYRLYGKEGEKESGREATGVSIVVNKSFFREEIRNPVNTMYVKYSPRIPEKYALFRCAYINPATKHVEALGRRDAGTFYLKKREPSSLEARIDDYDEILKIRLDEVRDCFKNLLKEIEDNKRKLSDLVLCELLLQLRFLVKHEAFKEEQECRIVEVAQLADNEKVVADSANNSMYITYINMREHMKRIYFAPKTTHFLYFRDRLQKEGLTYIRCLKSEHPFN